MQTTQSPEEPEEISLLDIAIALGEERRVFLGVPIALTLITAMYVLLATPIFTAVAVIAPAEAQLFVMQLQSAKVRDLLVKEHQLVQAYRVEKHLEARSLLESNTRITKGKLDNAIRIEVDSSDPVLAANLANDYWRFASQQVEDMQALPIKHRREVFEDLIQRLKTDTENMSEVAILARAHILRLMRNKEKEYAEARQSLPGNPSFLEWRINELSSLNRQITELDRVISLPSGDVLSKQANTSLMDVLIQQRDSALFTDGTTALSALPVIDAATPPEKSRNGKGLQMVGMAGVIGLIFGALAALARSSWRKMRDDPRSATRVDQFKRAWKFRA